MGIIYGITVIDHVEIAAIEINVHIFLLLFCDVFYWNQV